MSDLPFYGYNGEVWGVTYAAYNYLAGFIDQNPRSFDEINQLAKAVYGVCRNSLNAINANMLLTAWQAELAYLQETQSIPVTVPQAVQTALNNRVIAIEYAIMGLEQITPETSVVNIPVLVGHAVPSIPDCDIFNFYETFNGETPPAGTTNANLQYAAQTQALLFNQLATAIGGYQGFYKTEAYDGAVRMAQTSQVMANVVNGLQSGPSSTPDSITITPLFSPNLDPTQNWNTVIAMPSLVMEAYQLATPPYSLASQQQSLIKYVILLMMQQLARMMIILRSPGTQPVNLVTIQVGQTLQDIAGIHLGNFELWPQIAYINNLQPPYIGPVTQPGIAGWGTQIFLPTPGTNPAAMGSVPSYINNFLGIDLFIGPINGDMPPWTGDFQTISGYDNLRWALGRRLQTTLGSFIYHPSYGSRIPPEVGNVQSVHEASLINTFGISALASDPRVERVISSVTQLLPNFAVAFQASVQPSGFGTSPVLLNEVLQPPL